MKIATAAALSLYLLLPAAAASGAETYAGGGLGISWMSPTVAGSYLDAWHARNYGPGFNCETLTCDTPAAESGGTKLFAGYRPGRYFAIEAFAAYLGPFGGSASDGLAVTALSSADVWTAGAAIVGFYPIGEDMALIGKYGFHSWSASGHVTVDDTALPGSLAESFSRTGLGDMIGLGIQGDRNANWSIRFEYEMYAINFDRDSLLVGHISGSVMYRF